MSARIVVGVDGSDTSVDALRWAAEAARLRDATLEVVHAWSVPYLGEVSAVAVLDYDYEAEAAQLLAEVVREALGENPGITVEQHTAQDSAAHAVTSRAAGADLVVVGSRGRGGFKGLLLGSVSQQVAQHAPCPVVIIPPSDRAGT